ncbi:hypothetical protein B0H14DRAFT_2618402 [Mycena olivaceomarginata]|nr:hypothetical protein B0H14DRAFT_2618402 [Mycena olivaceomarginata]
MAQKPTGKRRYEDSNLEDLMTQQSAAKKSKPWPEMAGVGWDIIPKTRRPYEESIQFLCTARQVWQHGLDSFGLMTGRYSDRVWRVIGDIPQRICVLGPQKPPCKSPASPSPHI